MPSPRELHFYRTTLIAFALIVTWDFLGWDLEAAGLFGSSAGFPFNDNWFATHVLHAGVRQLNYLLVLLCAFCIWRPVGILRRLTRGDRMALFAGLLVALSSVALFKRFSATSCPWDLHAFGGSAAHVSHWWWFVRDGGPGHCFPAGHASIGFAWVALYFGLRPAAPRAARRALAAALLAGLVLGLVQQARGAHFMSHTLWTAWLCWTSGGLVQRVYARWRERGRPMVSPVSAAEPS